MIECLLIAADYSPVCTQDHHDTPAYTRLKLLASVVIIIYPVGIPVLYAVLLFLVHRRGGGGAAQMLGFLTRSYRAPFFWWELVRAA